MRACVVSWGGADAARGWRGPSGGAGPVGVVGTLPSTVTSLAASRGSAALDVSGRVFTWGFNDSRGGGDAFVRGRFGGAVEASGQLGRALPAGAAPAAARHTPATVALDEPAVAVASGRYHTLAAGASGRVFSWGLNDHGQLGRAARSLAPGGAGAGGGGLRCRDGPACVDGTAAANPNPKLNPNTNLLTPTLTLTLDTSASPEPNRGPDPSSDPNPDPNPDANPDQALRARRAGCDRPGYQPW